MIAGKPNVDPARIGQKVEAAEDMIGVCAFTCECVASKSEDAPCSSANAPHIMHICTV